MKRTKAQSAIERIHQSAMNLRDSLSVGDPDVAEKRERVYRRAYFKAWKTNDLELFKTAARVYRKGIREASEAERTKQSNDHDLLVALKAAEGLAEQVQSTFGPNGMWPELHKQAAMTSFWVRAALRAL